MIFLRRPIRGLWCRLVGHRWTSWHSPFAMSILWTKPIDFCCRWCIRCGKEEVARAAAEAAQEKPAADPPAQEPRP